jgi:hypothetical protein
MVNQHEKSQKSCENHQELDNFICFAHVVLLHVRYVFKVFLMVYSNKILKVILKVYS